MFAKIEFLYELIKVGPISRILNSDEEFSSYIVVGPISRVLEMNGKCFVRFQTNSNSTVKNLNRNRKKWKMTLTKPEDIPSFMYIKIVDGVWDAGVHDDESDHIPPDHLPTLRIIFLLFTTYTYIIVHLF